MTNEALALLQIFQTKLGASRDQCNTNGKALWDRIEAVKVGTASANIFARELEVAAMEVANGERKPGKIPMEPITRLIHFARTSSTKDATLRP